MKKLVGHERQIAYLDKLRERERLAHAYLFHGPERIGKFTIAKRLAQALYCEENPRTLAATCGECEPCQKIETGQYPDVIWLGGQHTLVSRKEKRKEIPLEDIQELKHYFSLAPIGRRWRVAMVDQAHTFSPEAANAFLKLLEEPGDQTLFLLVAPSRELLLPTIVSRVQAISFSLLPERVLRTLIDLGRHDVRTQQELLTLANGRPGSLVSLLAEPRLLEQEWELWNRVQTVLEHGTSEELFSLTETVATQPALQNTLTDYVLRFLRTRLISPSSGTDRIKTIRQMKAVQQIHTILETTNVNPRVAFDLLIRTALTPT